MNKTEAQTRREIIDKRLLQAGWDVDNPIRVAKELDIWIGLPEGTTEPETPYQGHLFADYALLGNDGKPIAVVEAKKTSVEAEMGKEQARNYAEQIQKTVGGPMPFVFYTNGYDIFFWDTERYPPRKVYGFPTNADLERIKFLRDNSRSLSPELINSDIAGRPYQIEAIRSVLEKVEQKKRKFLLVMATGTGKTRTCMALLDVLMRGHWAQRVLFLVDRIALQRQALDTFKEYLPNAPVWPKQGEKKFSKDRRVYVSTYPTMLNIIEQETCPLSPHFFDIIIADESHRSIYNVYKNIFDYFDAVEIGLTATPKDHVDTNTFKLFGCEDGLPTVAYSYDEAVNSVPPYLSDFEVLKIRTKFQQEGINSQTIADADKKRLLMEGHDPDEISFEGTELEKRVSNKGTNALIVREFMEESIKDPNGVLPGKTIFFALSKKHAYRLCEVFNSLCPEYMGQLAEVIISDVRGVHGRGGILDRFTNNGMPRIAISVDMLDTGIDVREIVNLVFVKPVFSYTKFWQMIGRGTRILDPTKIKPWCPTKDKFLIMDCWKNFDYWKMNTKGRTGSTTRPLPVRLLLARLNKLQAAMDAADDNVANNTKKKIQDDIKQLPKNSVVVLDNRKHIDQSERLDFWDTLTPEKMEFLHVHIAPIMRCKSNTDFKAMRFELDIVELATAKLAGDSDKFETLKEGVVEKISALPLTVNIVANEKDFISKVTSNNFWMTFSDDDLDEVIEHLAPLMKFRDEGPGDPQFKTDLTDLLSVKEYIEFGPEHERLSIDKYRQMIEDIIQEMVKTTPALQKLTTGEEISISEIEELANILKKKCPNATLETLQGLYDNRTAKFVELIKHILGLEPLATFTELVSFMFDEFIREHNNYGKNQIQFILILKSFILQKGKAEKRDLVNAPFTQLHPQGIRGIFTKPEIDEILGLVQKIAA